MITVREMLAAKRNNLTQRVSPTTTVRDAAQIMNEAGTGSVLVEVGGKVVGIFTERDLMRRVVAADKLPGATTVGDVMTTALVTARPDATLADCGQLMSERRIRHLPVFDGEEVIGIVTTGDLLAHELAEKSAKIQHLEDFVFYTRS
ncbi:MAG: CBS domain-containing protein [Gemmatimonadetes bacterium]|jgi:CBS domain-containing protein|nr:CBS domain-containing protein [Gemmatimonadota bacterium]MBP6444119.1 CBS domain-containing protein [Gemmatimonadales bacterium]MBK9549425.1 CBS domain-containing protein [Gemmatimonadota bacterium]MBP6570889.1 CBS domain-containing protein [Gemmatimonadales bacterium]MBP7621161.1 CBS domain-containing protein [Gemmatimonadales bacterium]